MADSVSRQRSDKTKDETIKVLNELKVAFNLPNDTAVIGRSLALARLIAQEAKDDHTIMIERKDGSQLQIVLDA